MSALKGGKKPLSEKGKESPFRKQIVFGDELTIDPKFKEAAKQAGYELRWIDAKKHAESQGYNKYHWELTKRDDFGALEAGPKLIFGATPDGFIRRGTMVLAKRSIEISEAHRDMLKEKRERQENVINKHAEEMRESARKSGVETTVDSSYSEE